jgi:hypothetical protein
LASVVEKEGPMQVREKVENELQPNPQLEAVKERLVAINESVVGFVKAHPAQCLLGAIALGYLAGRLARSGFGHGKA